MEPFAGQQDANPRGAAVPSASPAHPQRVLGCATLHVGSWRHRAVVPPGGLRKGHHGGIRAARVGRRLILCSPQDQLSADMYNFVAKEVDYANYFQTVSATRPHGTPLSPFLAVGVTAGAVSPPLSADRGAGGVPSEILSSFAERPASN